MDTNGHEAEPGLSKVLPASCRQIRIETGGGVLLQRFRSEIATRFLVSSFRPFCQQDAGSTVNSRSKVMGNLDQGI